MKNLKYAFRTNWVSPSNFYIPVFNLLICIVELYGGRGVDTPEILPLFHSLPAGMTCWCLIFKHVLYWSEYKIYKVFFFSAVDQIYQTSGFATFEWYRYHWTSDSLSLWLSNCAFCCMNVVFSLPHTLQSRCDVGVFAATMFCWLSYHISHFLTITVSFAGIEETGGAHEIISTCCFHEDDGLYIIYTLKYLFSLRWQNPVRNKVSL